LLRATSVNKPVSTPADEGLMQFRMTFRKQY
jgi:hypothetical protein